MKRLILTAAIMGALLSGNLSSSYAYKILPYEKLVKSTKVTFYEVNDGARLSIKDKDGRTLYSEKVKEDGSYTRSFDLTEFPVDRYYFELDKDDEITVLPFEVGEENVILDWEKRNDIPKPRLGVQRDQVFLLRDVDDEQTLKIEILYEGYHLVYKEKVDKVGKILRKYDFSTSVSGEYLFNIYYNGRLYSKYVNVESGLRDYDI